MSVKSKDWKAGNASGIDKGSTSIPVHKRKGASSPSHGGNVPAHKAAVDHAHVYPGRPFPEEYELQTVKPQKGAARRAANKQIPDSARPAKKK